ncbi:MAG: hypothetical protein ACFCA4_03955 [Cyanophyceae cyanobacterium]
MNQGKRQPSPLTQLGVLLAGFTGVGLLSGCQSPENLDTSASANLKPTASRIIQAVIAPFQVPIGAPTSPPLPSVAQTTTAQKTENQNIVVPSKVPTSPLGSDGSDTITDDTWQLTMYLPDKQCDRLVPKTVPVQGDRPLDVAVGRVLVEVASDNLDLRGYQLQVNTRTRTAAIALRLRPGASRKFAALSSCEQLTLFGSIRATLTQNPQWPIDHVTFIDGANQIRL